MVLVMLTHGRMLNIMMIMQDGTSFISDIQEMKDKHMQELNLEEE